MVDSNGETGRADDLRAAIESFYFGYRAFTSAPDAVLADRGLGRTHHRILYFIHRNPGVTVGGLLQILDVSKQAAHRPLRDLQKQGLVVSTPSRIDRRHRELRTTDEGARLEAHLTGLQMDILDAAFTAAGSPAESGWRDVMTAMTGAPHAQDSAETQSR